MYNQCYINGCWIGAIGGATFDVFAPRDGRKVQTVPNCSDADAAIAVNAAYTALQEWRRLPSGERAQLLRKTFDLAVKESQVIAGIIHNETGKPLSEAQKEVAFGNEFLEFYAEEAKRMHGEILPSKKHSQALVFKEPLGVVGVITPFNFPYAMVTRKVTAALAAGCTCVLKPAEDTPLSALFFAHLVEAAGVPSGVFNVVTAARDSAASIGKYLCESALVSGISFTGSTQTGKLLYAQCAPSVKRLSLEMGGNAPFMVFETADLELAVKSLLRVKLLNCGQVCVAPNRILVQRQVYHQFVEMLKQGLSKVTEIGTLINIRQKGKVERLVEDALAKGARNSFTHSHKPSSVLSFPPMILEGVSSEMEIYSTEIFGPVLCIYPFDSESQAVSFANDTEKGLAAYLFSQDISQIFRVSRDVQVGMCCVNETDTLSAELPFGGVKESGFGREGSHYGIDDFVNVKLVHLGNLDGYLA